MKLKILAVIPARAGSKGVPRKNTKMLGGRPLLGWSILEAKKSKLIDRLILSTEDEEIAEVGKSFGVDVPFKRPKELAGDKTHTPEILIHALNEIEKIDRIVYDIIVLLQPTVPFRKTEHIDKAIQQFISEKFDSLITVKKQDYPPWWMFKLEDKKLSTVFKYGNDVNVFNMERQEFPDIYKPNGSVYVTKTVLLRENNQLVNQKSCGYLIVEDEFQVNIDTPLDFDIAESIAKRMS